MTEFFKHKGYALWTEKQPEGDFKLLINFHPVPINGDLNDNITVDLTKNGAALARDLLALSTPDAHENGEPFRDNLGVANFAGLMVEKLRFKRTQGYSGWETATTAHLAKLLFDHLVKGDAVDLGNFAMMLKMRDEVDGAIGEAFKFLLNKHVLDSDEVARLNNRIKGLESTVVEKDDRMTKAERRAREAEEELRKVRSHLEVRVEVLQQQLANAQASLQRALGYIDRVNEGQAIPQQVLRRGPLLEEGRHGTNSEPYMDVGDTYRGR